MITLRYYITSKNQLKVTSKIFIAENAGGREPDDRTTVFQRKPRFSRLRCRRTGRKLANFANEV